MEEGMIALPDRMGNEGVEARILIAECPGPADASYSFTSATEAMQLMDVVLWNRLKNPGPFLARGAKGLIDIVKAKGQFRGFEKYPNYNAGIKQNIQDAIDIANNAKDPRNGKYAEFLSKAIEIAKSSYHSDPSPGKLVAWRTSKTGSPGKDFIKYKTVLGNDFYYQ
jgi:hypothetical protein